MKEVENLESDVNEQREAISKLHEIVESLREHDDALKRKLARARKERLTRGSPGLQVGMCTSVCMCVF
jgi:hypothetical protein